LSWRRDRCLAAFGSLKTDVELDPLSFLILICISGLTLFGISTKDEELGLLSLYWIPKLHKCPFKQRYIAVHIVITVVK
jgi:hypothetical protein